MKASHGPAIRAFAVLGFAAASLIAVNASAQAPALSARDSTVGQFNPQAPLYGKLPKEIVEAKAINSGIIISSPPSTFIDPDSKELKGSEIDMIRALSVQLGVPFKVHPTEYGSFIPGLQARRFNMVSAFIADTEKRQQVVDFVDYYATGDVVLTHKSATFHIKTLDDLCGRSLAMDQGHFRMPQMQAQQAKCKAEGKPEMRLDVFRDGLLFHQGRQG